jgi:hypothetical protein
MINLNYPDKFFFFTSTLNDIIKKNHNKLKNLSIIYKTEKNNLNINDFLKIKDFCKKKKIKIYFPDNLKMAIRLGADGLFISSTNNKIYQPYKKLFKFLGAVHSQKEFYFKSKQKCDCIFLSPVFKTDKYSKTKKKSSYTEQWNKLFPDAKTLQERSQVTGVPVKYLQEVYNRGMAAWRTGHRPGMSQQAWSYPRVSSYLLCGKTHYTADADLVAAAKRSSKKANQWFSKTCKHSPVKYDPSK